MAKSTFGDLSTTAASNTSIDGNDMSENCNMSGVNNAIRALGAMGKGALTAVPTSGTDIYTATLSPAPDGYSAEFVYLVNFTSANTSTAPTLNLNSLGAIAITDLSGNALVAGSLNGRHLVSYDSSGPQFHVLNPAKTGTNIFSIADATNGGINVSTTNGVATLKVQPSDAVTKASPTTSDSILIMDAANSNVFATATLPHVVGALFSPITNSLSGNVALNNTSSYFDGPNVAQGTTGTWFVSGTVVINDSAADSAVFDAKLWDGVNAAIASARQFVPVHNTNYTFSLSGFVTSPAGNLRISVRNETATSGQLLANASGNGKDCTITAIRIA